MCRKQKKNTPSLKSNEGLLHLVTADNSCKLCKGIKQTKKGYITIIIRSTL